jgi:hypothetical protein
VSDGTALLCEFLLGAGRRVSMTRYSMMKRDLLFKLDVGSIRFEGDLRIQECQFKVRVFLIQVLTLYRGMVE